MSYKCKKLINTNDCDILAAGGSCEQCWFAEKQANKENTQPDRTKARLQSLLDRIRPNSEAAPWVIEELKAIINEI